MSYTVPDVAVIDYETATAPMGSENESLVDLFQNSAFYGIDLGLDEIRDELNSMPERGTPLEVFG
jgi:hypothetical protein